MGSRERAVLVLETRAVSARVTKHFVTIFSKTCWERDDLLAVVCVVFCTFPNVSWSTSESRVRLAL